MARKPKLIVSGVNGTMLVNGAQRIQSSVGTLIYRLKENGILYVPSSGRQYGNMQRIFSPVKKEIAYIAERGGLCRYKGVTISQTVMPYKLGMEIIDEINQHKECIGILTDCDTCYVKSDNMDFFYYMRDIMGYDVEVVPELEIAGMDCLKISLHQEEGELDVDFWREKFGDRCRIVDPGDGFLDFIPLGVGKTPALKELLSYLEINPENCIAIGSRDPDANMMDFVGCPIALKGSSDMLLQHAKYTADSVVEVLERILDGEGYDW